MTESPSESSASPAEDLASRVADIVGSSSWSSDHDTVRVYVDRADWVESVRKARDEAGLRFFSWLSAVDWARDVEVGEPVQDVESLEERYEVICRLSSIEGWEGAQLITAVPKDDPVVDSLVPVFGGAGWHEREAAEMFGIDFTGNPHLVNLYLPDAFEGNPLKKSFALLSREVRPWPGAVDVEEMPEIPAEPDSGEDGGGEE